MDDKNTMFVQSHRCSSYDPTSICTCNREIVNAPTNPILHRQARFLIICEGIGKINIQGRIYDIKKGDLVCILPYQYSEIISIEKDLVYNLIIFNFSLFNELIKSHLNFFDEDISLINLFTKNNVVNCDEKRFSEVVYIFNNLKDEIGMEATKSYEKSKSKFASVYISSQILHIISIFANQTKAIFNEEKDYMEDGQIFQYIYLNLSQNLTLSELASIFYMSPSSIGNYIRKVTGYSYSDLLLEMKLARVENFLLYTDLSLKEISKILNYSDFSYISKVFSSKRKYNTTEFRNVYKKINKVSKIKESPISYKIVDYIYANYDKDLNVTDVAKHFSITEQDLNYHLKYLVEKNFNCFLNYVRINKSMKFLLETDMPISKISEIVGYDNVRSYNRNFKKFYNSNPNKFRKQVTLQNT